MIYVALGGNRPFGRQSVRETLSAALGFLDAAGCVVKAVSRLYTTPAWPDPADPPFLNAVAMVEWRLDAEKLLTLLHQAEHRFGRRRTTPNAPRTLDLDLLDMGGEVREAAPTLPHPRMLGRAFVLLPLRDVAPNWRHPVTGETIDQLISKLPLAARRQARIVGGCKALVRRSDSA